MQILKVNPLTRNTDLKRYQRNVRMLVDQFLSAGALVPMERIYGVETIHKAIDTLYIGGDNYICIPSGTISAVILKTLQFGGYGVKALNILTRAGGSLWKVISMNMVKH